MRNLPDHPVACLAAALAAALLAPAGLAAGALAKQEPHRPTGLEASDARPGAGGDTPPAERGADQGEPGQRAARPAPAAGSGLEARVRAPASVALGEPFDLVVELQHAPGVRPTLVADAVGEGWVVLEERGAVRSLDGARAITEVRWTVCALEPGEGALPALMASFADGHLEAPFVDRAAAGIEVRPALAPGEDEPRPPRGFREPPPAGRSLPVWVLPLAALVLVAALALLVWRLRRRRPAARPVCAPTPAERLAAIDARALTDERDVRAAYYELTAAVRAGLDARSGLSRQGMTDDEWLAAVAAGGELDGEQREALGALLCASSEVKYGGARPTHWALEEALARARAALEGTGRDPVGRERELAASNTGSASLPALALLFPQADDAVQSAAEASLHLWGDYYLGDPWFLTLAPLVLLVLLHGSGRRARARGRVSALPAGLERLPRSLPQRLGWIAPALQALALLAVVVGLARPLRGNELRTTTSEGVDIALLVDRSSSMKYEDLEAGRSRLDVTKEVVGDFAVRRMTDRVGASDNVALLTFARYPRLLCPFTLDVGALTGFLEGVEVVRPEHELEDGTAIGRGLAKAVSLLIEMDARSKVIVLLTDGKNNVDDIPPMEAARAAAEQGIKVYTVLAGRYVFQEDVFGRVYPTERELDATELEAIAELTGARFFRARDKDGLEAVYAEIEAAERTEREEERYTETFDLYPPFLILAAVLHLLAWISSATWARRLP